MRLVNHRPIQRGELVEERLFDMEVSDIALFSEQKPAHGRHGLF